MEAGVYKRENNSGTDEASLHLDLPAAYNLYRDLKKTTKKLQKLQKQQQNDEEEQREKRNIQFL